MTDNLPGPPLPKPKTPLDVMLGTMRFWDAKVDAIGAQLEALIVELRDAADEGSGEIERRALDLLEEALIKGWR